jgi:glutathionylspermidine synthase
VSASYEAFAERLLATGIINDPWLDGRPRFRAEPVLYSRAQQADLYRAAEAVAAVYDELVGICAGDAALIDDFFALSPFQRLMWTASFPLWHGVARADAFFTVEGGVAICELNSDTPTGQAEAVLLNRLALDSIRDAEDPNAGLGARFCAMIEAYATNLLAPEARVAPLTIGIVYPTEITEDLPLVRLYRTWFEERGWTVAMGSPYNLARASGLGVGLFDSPCAVILRHYKTDWWGERLPVWDDDEPFPDPAPLAGPLSALFEALLERRCVMVNPFGAVLTQNKRSMAFMWEHKDRFSASAQAAIEAHIPRTSRLELLDPEQLVAERADWVLKSDYGCEGDEVIIGRHVDPQTWNASLIHAVPGRWIAQRYFAAIEGPEGESVNHGVFLVAGEAAGLYARVQRGPTDVHAESAPALIVP